MIALHARIEPVARRVVALSHAADGGEVAAVALVVRGKLPVQQREQVIFFERRACHGGSLAQARRRHVEEDQARGLRATIVENAFFVPPGASKLCCRASSMFQGAKRRSSSSRPKRQ